MSVSMRFHAILLAAVAVLLGFTQLQGCGEADVEKAEVCCYIVDGICELDLQEFEVLKGVPSAQKVARKPLLQQYCSGFVNEGGLKGDAQKTTLYARCLKCEQPSSDTRALAQCVAEVTYVNAANNVVTPGSTAAAGAEAVVGANQFKAPPGSHVDKPLPGTPVKTTSSFAEQYSAPYAALGDMQQVTVPSDGRVTSTAQQARRIIPQ